MEWDAVAWHRQPCDDALTWDLFQAYLALPLPRAFSVLARRPGCPYPEKAFPEIARRNWWERRAELWDDHLSRIVQTTTERVTGENAAARANRHAAVAKRALRLVEREFDTLLAMQEQAPNIPLGSLMPPATLARLMHWGVLIERLACGDSTANTETTITNNGPDLSALSLDDLRALKSLQQKAGIE